MTLREIALQIAPEHRRQIIENDLVGSAIPSPLNEPMQVLFVIWTTYIDPGKKGQWDCPYCLAEVLKNFKSILPELKQLVIEDNLLEI